MTDEFDYDESTPTGNWRDSLPEDLADDPSLEDFGSQEDLVKSYIHLNKMMGTSVRIPTEDSGKDVWDDFYGKIEHVPGVARVDSDDIYNKLGRPEDPSKYHFSIPEDYQQNQDVMSAVESFRQQAYESKLNNEQANAMIKFDLQRQEQYNYAMAEMYKQSESVLRSRWGADYENRIDGAKKVLDKYQQTYPEAVQVIKDTPLGNNPALIEMLSDLAGTFNEEDVITPLSDEVRYGMTALEAEEKLAEITSNLNHPYYSGDPRAKAEVERLYRVKYGDAE